MAMKLPIDPLVIQLPKTEKSERLLDIPKVLLQKLREHRTRQLEEKMALGQNWQDTGLVFTTSLGTPIDPRGVKRKLDAILIKANMRHYRIHDLRHFFAALLLAQGVELKVVSELLGHSDIRITGDIYAHVLPSLKKQTIDLMNSILTG
jgi:integrase